jgi:molecular chaperone GrpE
MNVDEGIKTTGEEEKKEPVTEGIDTVSIEENVDPAAILQEKLNATHERLLRTAAELDNFRKRARRDVEDAQNRGRADVLAEVLPVIDSVDLALSSLDEGTAKGIVEGLEMIKRQFLSAVDRFGVKQVESIGKAFDPNVHEAVSQIYSDAYAAGQIVEEMRKGYLIGEKLLRAAMVAVSRGPLPSAEEEASSEDDTYADAQNTEESAGSQGEQ